MGGAQEQVRRGVVDHARDLRDRIRSRPALRVVYRFVVALVGVALTLGGLLLVPLPGPGWLIVFAGLAVLATEFVIARRLLDFAVDRLARWTRWVRRHGPLARGAVGMGVLACALGAVYGTVALTGVPAWVPDGVVPPLPGLDR